MGEQDEWIFMKPPKLRFSYLLLLAIALILGILIVGWLPQDISTGKYIPMHIILMILSVVISFMVAFSAWFDYKQSGGLRELILSITFLMVGMIDVSHALSYPEMPAFFTPNTFNKSTTLWVYSRIIESIGLGTAVLISPLRKKKVTSPLVLAIPVIINLAVILGVTYQILPIPLMFDSKMGQTNIKVFLDYLVIFIKGFALNHLIKMQRNYLADYYLQAALVFGIFSETVFTLYTSAFDTYNFLGHIYKILEFACIMKAFFVLSLVRLHQTNSVLEKQKTQMVEINEKLNKANKLKNEYLANTNHELRTPLTAIIAFTELLLDKETGHLNDIQKDYINEINESGQQLLNYINNLLDLSKIEAGKVEMYYESIYVKDLFSSVVKKMQPIFKVKNQRLFCEIENNLPTIYIDTPKVKQILINLLSNAHKYSPEGSHVKLTAKISQSQDHVIIGVHDNGIGISKENQALIFEKFKQVNNSFPSTYPGTGLGLTLVKHLVHLHGGQIKVKSKLGQGSCFYFSIPFDIR